MRRLLRGGVDSIFLKGKALYVRSVGFGGGRDWWLLLLMVFEIVAGRPRQHLPRPGGEELVGRIRDAPSHAERCCTSTTTTTFFHFQPSAAATSTASLFLLFGKETGPSPVVRGLVGRQGRRNVTWTVGGLVVIYAASASVPVLRFTSSAAALAVTQSTVVLMRHNHELMADWLAGPPLVGFERKLSMVIV